MLLLSAIFAAAAALAPVDVPIGSIDGAVHNHRRIRTRGVVVESFTDEVSPDTHFLILKDKGDFLIAYACDSTQVVRLPSVDAEIEVTGHLRCRVTGSRNYTGPMLKITRSEDIRVVTPPPEDPFAVPTLDETSFVPPHEVRRRGRQRLTGRVLATWHGDHLLLSGAKRGCIRVRLAHGTPLPAPGDAITVSGYPESDLFRINLTRAVWKPATLPAEPAADPEPLTVAQATTDESGRLKYKIHHHGMLVRIRGVVRRRPPSPDGQWRIEAEDDGRIFQIDASSNPSAAEGVSEGAVVEATGVCLLETGETGAGSVFPHLTGLVVILRSPADLRIVRRPPWWTVSRLALLVAVLAVALVGVLLWNRSINRLAVRRGRALAREQLVHAASELKVEERTRLAVELHDALSQNLASVAFQVAAGGRMIESDPRTARTRIATAEQMLNSCRTELKNCLADLRSDALEEPDFEEALRQTLARIAGDAEIRVRFDVPRRRLADTTAQAILAIVRELASNAIRHGGAATVRVAGTTEGGLIRFSVSDDGCGFDPQRAPGPIDGHFGLEGVRERLRRLDGAFEIARQQPAGMRAEVHVPLLSPKEKPA